MYDAWEAANPQERLSLARQALKISRNCADDDVLLGEGAADTLEEAIADYRQGVQAGERGLGERAFEEDVGHFWGALETRLGKKRMPARLPDYIGFGDKNEAVAYVAESLPSWLKTDGALDWLRLNS